MLKGKVVVVTGGAGLLGRGFCAAVAEHGGCAVVADRDLPAATAVASEICARYPGGAEAQTLDITDKASVCALIDRLHARHGRIDAVVNNAFPRNRSWGRKMEEVTYADFCENVNLNLGGYFLVSQQFAIYFRRQGGGNIVNMGSIYGTTPPRFDIYEGTHMTKEVEYVAIKAGVLQLTRYFAQYLKGSGVRVNALSPGGIWDQQPEAFLQGYRRYCGQKGMLAPEDVSGSLVFLLSDASKYVLGQNLVVDDGFSL